MNDYPVILPGQSMCSYCKEILEDEYLTVGDNFLLVKYFDDPEGSDNMFCSKECLCKSLFVETIDIEEDSSNG